MYSIYANIGGILMVNVTNIAYMDPMGIYIYICKQNTEDTVVIQQMDRAGIGELEKSKVNCMHAWAWRGWPADFYFT